MVASRLSGVGRVRRQPLAPRVAQPSAHPFPMTFREDIIVNRLSSKFPRRILKIYLFEFAILHFNVSLFFDENENIVYSLIPLFLFSLHYRVSWTFKGTRCPGPTPQNSPHRTARLWCGWNTWPTPGGTYVPLPFAQAPQFSMPPLGFSLFASHFWFPSGF